MKKNSMYLSVQQVADYLEVSKQAVNKWINDGNFKAYRLPSGRIKILRSDFLNYLKKNNLYVDDNFFDKSISKIVIIDDDTKIQNLFKQYFKNYEEACQVEYADDGIAGLLKIGTIKPEIVLIDIEMEGMNGIEVSKKILDDPSLSDTKIIIISGYISKYQDELSKLPSIMTIEKPFKFNDLDEKLMPLFNGSVEE